MNWSMVSAFCGVAGLACFCRLVYCNFDSALQKVA